mgnify:CR=1 FL=1|tara:strand:- start:213 stop:623 length:411 start_codon:yes stop_codon:yes gene_type:complete
MSKDFIFKTKVYYEDTDAGGVVYYANYLKFTERARTEVINELGFTNKFLIEKYGAYIVVKSCNFDFKKSAFLEDELKIISSINFISKTSFKMIQKIKKKDQLIALSNIHLVVINKNGKILRIPEALFFKLNQHLLK